MERAVVLGLAGRGTVVTMLGLWLMQQEKGSDADRTGGFVYHLF